MDKERFNSLQTGKCIARNKSEPISKMLFAGCFNSLQTGKCIASCYTITSIHLKRCFNSLQTGKCIASETSDEDSDSGSQGVSIPFKRESV